MSSRRPADKRTRWPCIVVRHRVGCPANGGKRCRCRPGYIARVWDPAHRRPLPSPTFETPSEGISWQQDTRQRLRDGTPTAVQSIYVHEGSEQFIVAMNNGTALNKKGKPYKQSAITSLTNNLRGRVKDELGPLLLAEVRRGHVQTMIDELVAERLSGSRVRNVVGALRSLYNYSIPRDLASVSPITEIVLPAMGEKPRERIATAVELRELLRALKPADAVPFALAAYATARSQEVRNLAWPEVDWEAAKLYLADEEDYSKSKAARRPFPLIEPLRGILRAEWERQGRPDGEALVCPGRKTGGRNSGKLSTAALYTRADAAWETKKFLPIRLQDCRHTASSWMRAAGIDLKTRSVLMGHATTASTDGGRGSITDDRYTHLLPGEVEKAGQQLEAYLASQVADI